VEAERRSGKPRAPFNFVYFDQYVYFPSLIIFFAIPCEERYRFE